jgi:putative transposase
MEAVLARKAYRSDLTDEQWKIIEPLLPQPFSVGRPRTVDFREIMNAILYLLTSGCAWEALPHDFPAEGTVRDYFHQWRRTGLWAALNKTLRQEVRRHDGRDDEPSAAIIDSQSVKATRTSGSRGYDAGKKSTAQSDIWLLIRWGWCSAWLFMLAAFKIGTERNWCCPICRGGCRG